MWLVPKALGRRFAHFSAAPAARGALDVWGKGQEDPSLKVPIGARSLLHPSAKGKAEVFVEWHPITPFPRGVTRS